MWLTFNSDRVLLLNWFALHCPIALSSDHARLRSEILLSQVWCPPSFSSFVLVDDDGQLLNRGTPTGQLPPLSQRRLASSDHIWKRVKCDDAGCVVQFDIGATRLQA